MRVRTFFIVLAGLGGAAPLAAQPPPDSQPPRPMRQRLHQPGMVGRAAGGPGMGMHGFAYSPRLLIERREVLELSAEQVGQLEALAQELAEGRDATDQARQTHHARMAELWKADEPDVQAITGELKAMMAIQQDAQLKAASAAARAKALLTAEQRGRVAGWTDARGTMGRRGFAGPGDRMGFRRDLKGGRRR